MTCRLLYVVGQLRTGGLERQLFYLLRKLDRTRYSPAVAVWRLDENERYTAPLRELGVPLHGAPESASRPGKVVWLRSLIRRERPEVVHSYSFYTNVAAYLATLGSRALPVGSIRSTFARDMREPGCLLGTLSARWPRSQVCNSRPVLDEADRRRFFRARRLFHVPNGVDLDAFKPSPVPTTSPARVLGVGSLLAVKRWDRVLRLAAAAAALRLDVAFDIAGSGPLAAELAAESRRLGVSDRVRFLGEVRDVAALMREAAFVVHTSDAEGCPNAVMEAMACGRAVVATAVGEVPYLVREGVSGFVVPRDDECALLDRVGRLGRDPALRQRMGSQARAEAGQDFGLDRLVERTLAAYRAAGWPDR